MMRLAVLAVMLAGVTLAVACSGSPNPGEVVPASQTDMPASTSTAVPSPTPEAGCRGRSGENGYPVDIGRAAGFCVNWVAANDASGYRVSLIRGSGQFEYHVAPTKLEFSPPSGERPEYGDPPAIRCFKETAFRVTVFAESARGQELLGGVDVTDGCVARQFTASGCVAPAGVSAVSWLQVNLDEPGAFVPLGCIAWIDAASGEKGFQVEIAYSAGDRLRYETPANTHELIVPPADRPPADPAEAFKVHRKDFTIQVAAVYDDHVEPFAATSVIIN